MLDSKGLGHLPICLAGKRRTALSNLVCTLLIPDIVQAWISLGTGLGIEPMGIMLTRHCDQLSRTVDVWCPGDIKLFPSLYQH